ncbi:helix-turn-helix domain-containing protein [Actinokineospora diospyrosa]|uniref:Helix-turn-helix protein n=1 Tax=Actinokineospora diospyrosa TaxID=103728 RepID=A0ABT1INF3_9PSEU|nr:helix-turn-helix transcriptional regulator [Actinokineospora diospyrosa]MCP2274194.1 helix-turn-helix protein [Actinokineospora diospyrosa]
MSTQPQDWDAVARCITQRLTELGWQQHDLAARADVSQCTIREIQRNTIQRNRSPRTLTALSTALKLHPDHLQALLHERTPLPADAATDRPELDAIEQRLADMNAVIKEVRLDLARVLYILRQHSRPKAARH